MSKQVEKPKSYTFINGKMVEREASPAMMKLLNTFAAATKKPA